MRKNPPEPTQTAILRSLEGFFALTMVVLLLALATLALLGSYQLALADWQAARQTIANSQDS